MADKQAVKYTSKTMTDIVDETRDENSFTYEELKCKYEAALRMIEAYKEALSKMNFVFKGKRSDDDSEIKSTSLLTITPEGDDHAHYYLSMPNSSCSCSIDANGNITKISAMFKKIADGTLLIEPEGK